MFRDDVVDQVVNVLFEVEGLRTAAKLLRTALVKGSVDVDLVLRVKSELFRISDKIAGIALRLG